MPPPGFVQITGDFETLVTTCDFETLVTTCHIHNSITNFLSCVWLFPLGQSHNETDEFHLTSSTRKKTSQLLYLMSWDDIGEANSCF